MGNKDGRMTTCDYPGCNEWCFCKRTGTEETDGGYFKRDTFEKLPDGWQSFYDNKKGFMLCPKHAAERRQIIDDFYTKGEAVANGSN